MASSSSGLGVDGLVSGMDTAGLITKLMTLERKPLDQAQKQKTELQTKDDAWRDVNTRLYNLQSKVAALKTATTFRGRNVSLGSNDYFTATASSAAAASSYQVEVIKLAKAHVVTSDMKTSATTSLNYAGTFQINGKDVSITATDTLSSIADKINSTSGIGVTASVVKLGENQFKMTLTSQKTGVSNGITATDGGNVLKNLGIYDGGFTNKVQDAADAQIKVNGLTVERSSNTITDVINGVTLSLKKEGATNMSVSTDTESIVKAVKDFVEQYNSAMGFIRDSMAYDKDKKTKGTLFGESSLVYLQSEVRNYLSKTVSSVAKEVNQLGLIGISTGAYNSGIDNAKSGDLVLDEGKLRTALNDHFDDVAKLFGAKITNVASAANGATITASSQFNEQYPVTSLIDGRTGSEDWGNGGGWNDATSGSFPDTVEISFNGSKTINSINLYTLDSATLPASTYGVSDVTLEYWDAGSSSWKKMKQASDPEKDLTITGNNRGIISVDFASVTTSKVRVSIDKANGANDFSRLTEVEVMQKNDGIFSNLYNKLWDLTRSGGVVSTKRDSIASQQKTLDKRIEQLNDLMTRKEEMYRTKFNAMEKALSKIQTQSSWLSNQIGQLSANSSSNK